jgi:phage terminase large subunit-like protein
MAKKTGLPKPKPPELMTRGERVIAFIEEYCRVPEGKWIGQPLRLDPFQKQFILAVYDNAVPTSRAYLSIARKNGKTALIAAICLAHLVGPVAVQNSQIISGARSRDQAALVFKLMVKMLQLETRLTGLTRVIPSSKTIMGLKRNVEYRAISADAKTAHGLSPIVAILDEVGQVKGPSDEFVDAIETSQGAHDAPLLFAISTQAAQDTDLFSIWLDDAINSRDPTIVCHLYTAPKDCDLLDELAWVSANPALGKFRSLDDLRKLAEKAQRMPSFESAFRNLNLNQRVETNNPFVSRDVWNGNCGLQTTLEGKRVWFGLDLSAVSDLTALIGVTEDGSVHSTFWLPEEGLEDRAKEARAPYGVWAKQGFLNTTPGKTIQYEFIAEHLRALFDRCDVQALAFDRYNMRFLRPWLEKAGFTEEELERFVDFGQGFVSMSPALRELEVRLIEAQLRHGDHPVLKMCAANAAVVTDPAGNRKFTKSKSTGRIDGMVGLAMAVGVMPSKLEDQGDIDGFLSTPLKLTY